MKLVKIFPSLFDVFLFDGWENWSRWSKSRTGFIQQIGGKPVNGFLKTSIVTKLGEIK